MTNKNQQSWERWCVYKDCVAVRPFMTFYPDGRELPDKTMCVSLFHPCGSIWQQHYRVIGNISFMAKSNFFDSTCTTFYLYTWVTVCNAQPKFCHLWNGNKNILYITWFSVQYLALTKSSVNVHYYYKVNIRCKTS